MRFAKIIVMSLGALALAGTTIVVTACVEKETEKVDDNYVKENILPAAPAPKHPSGADLGGKVIYLGCDVDKENVAIGDRIKVTHYWKVVEAPGPEWRPFTHLNGNVGGEWINIDKTKMRDNYGVEKWKAGDIIRDEQQIPIQAGWKSNEATIYVGLYKKGGAGESGRIAVTGGPSDGHNRAIAATIHIGQKGAPAPAPSPGNAPAYVIRRATGPITIDGKADEPDWATAPSTGAFKLAQGGAALDGETSARLLYDDQNLYVFVDVADKDIASQYTKHDEPIWKEDAVELFIDADKNGKGYVELQVNPNNATFDSWWAETRAAGKGDEAWDSGMKTAVTVEGTLDKRDDADKAWHAEFAIPLAAVKGKDAAMAVTLPPRLGDTWKINIVRVEKPRDKNLTASAWAQISIADFHALDKLNLVAFGDAKGQLAAAAPPPAPASAPASAPATQPAPASQPAKPGKPVFVKPHQHAGHR